MSPVRRQNMKPTVIALALTTLSAFAGPISPAIAAESKVVRGTVSSMTGQSLTVKVGQTDLTFGVESKTLVEARGGSTKTAQAAAIGKPGPHLKDLLRTGQPVAVTYTEVDGAHHATEIKSIATLGASGSKASAETSAGVVKSMGADWITINGHSGGGSSFEQTFKIDASTKVFAKGAGTATAASGGKAPLMMLVASGDHVNVSYTKRGETLIASDVHVTAKAH
jgi:hypothetical protein